MNYYSYKMYSYFFSLLKVHPLSHNYSHIWDDLAYDVSCKY